MSSPASSNANPEWFLTTHWSVVLNARAADSSRAKAALETLCRTYWYPLYAFVRRLGHSPHDAEDLIQGFFAQCIEKNYLHAADQQKGRFRSFLLITLKRFLANEWDRARTRKRGGDRQIISLDAEQRYASESALTLSPDKLFERRWALTLLENVLAKLKTEQAEAGRLAIFTELQPVLTSRGTPYSELAKRLGMTESAVKVAVHRLRHRYRELLEQEIANTVSSASEIAEERRYLLGTFAS